ncbi:MAG: bifunctional phosphoribosylaminoimidazolecarboxamide formyltransferase/IMP cyclohydrolase [Pseudomonadota bacterium]
MTSFETGSGGPAAARAVRRALISVSDKAELDALAAALARHGIAAVSTGGTAARLAELGLAVEEVSAVTGQPEILDGRVKTLHPRIHGGVLARRDDPAHLTALEAAGGAPIDLVVVNLYPFERTVAAGADRAACVETIDIGGPALIRAAAKNHDDVAVVVDPDDYAELIAALDAGAGALPGALRRRLAAKAFARTAAYDAAIAAWFAEDAARETGAAAGAAPAAPARLTLSAERLLELRYGENPHQAAALYSAPAALGPPRPGVAGAALLQGKPLSYNNIADADAAVELVAELALFGRPACVIVKHANPCGAALGDDLLSAYEAALRADPVSAFGGVIAFSGPLDGATAAKAAEIFTEVAAAPEVSAEARAVFAAKPALRLLELGALPDPRAPGLKLRSVGGGLLAQSRDAAFAGDGEATVATKRAPGPKELADLRFAAVVAKHVASNAIVYAKDGAVVGVGAGQMSRLDSARMAAWKAEAAAREAGLESSLARGAVAASDAFFPFPDGLLATASAGVTAVIQPGGSVRDADVIKAADDAGLSMILTGVRNFRH